MKNLPDNKTVIQLSRGDMRRAIEYWLNGVMLKDPCHVTSIQELQTSSGGSFEIQFDRIDHESKNDFMGSEPIHGMDK